MYTDSIAKRYVTIISIMCVYAQFVIRKDIESKSSKNPLTLFFLSRCESCPRSCMCQLIRSYSITPPL